MSGMHGPVRGFDRRDGPRALLPVNCRRHRLDNSPCLSPDGTRIAYRSWGDGQGSDPRRSTSRPATTRSRLRSRQPTATSGQRGRPDGTQLALQREGRRRSNRIARCRRRWPEAIVVETGPGCADFTDGAVGVFSPDGDEDRCPLRDRPRRPGFSTQTGRSRRAAAHDGLSRAARLAAPGALTATTLADGGRPSRGAGRRRRRAASLQSGHGPPSHPDPRRRHRSGAGGGDPPRPRCDRRRSSNGRPSTPARPSIAEYGTPLPEHVLESIRRNKVALKGPITTPVGEGFRSVNVTLRQALGLYANLRPARSIKGLETRYEDVDLVIVRENTEDLYAGIEHMVGPDAAESIKIITREPRRSGSPASPSSTPSPTAGARSRPSTRPTS